MKIVKENLVVSVKQTSIHNLFTNQTDSYYKRLMQYLQTCDHSFIFALYASDNRSICHSVIDIHYLNQFINNDEERDQFDQDEIELLKPLLEFAQANQLDEIIF